MKTLIKAALAAAGIALLWGAVSSFTAGAARTVQHQQKQIEAAIQAASK